VTPFSVIPSPFSSVIPSREAARNLRDCFADEKTSSQ
jgi:hypothetical protein